MRSRTPVTMSSSRSTPRTVRANGAAKDSATCVPAPSGSGDESGSPTNGCAGGSCCGVFRLGARRTARASHADRGRIHPWVRIFQPVTGAGSSSDDELVAAARQGDSAALETLLVRYQPHLYRFGLRMCGNVEDAGDVAQESLISMARSVRDFRGDSSVSSWLYTIARRFCIKKRRRSKFAPTREESLDCPRRTLPGTSPIRGRTPSRQRPIGNWRPL